LFFCRVFLPDITASLKKIGKGEEMSTGKTPEESAESLESAVAQFMARACERGEKIASLTDEIVRLVQQAEPTPKGRVKLYARLMRRVREQLGIQKPGRKASSTQH
jgi:hypothetical protein